MTDRRCLRLVDELPVLLRLNSTAHGPTTRPLGVPAHVMRRQGGGINRSRSIVTTVGFLSTRTVSRGRKTQYVSLNSCHCDASGGSSPEPARGISSSPTYACGDVCQIKPYCISVVQLYISHADRSGTVSHLSHCGGQPGVAPDDGIELASWRRVRVRLMMTI